MSTIHSAQASSTSNFDLSNREVSGQREINGKPSYTVKQAADVLTRRGDRWLDANGDGWTDISYHMRDKAGLLFNTFVTGFRPLDADAQAAAKSALSAWSDVAKVRFTESPPGGPKEGTIGFSLYTKRLHNLEAVASTTRLPSTSLQLSAQQNPKFPRELIASEILLDGTNSDITAPSTTNGGRKTYVHEVGHALGLAHTHASVPEESDAQLVRYAQDSIGYTVMSYSEEESTGQNFNKNGEHHQPAGPMVDDIAAVQKLYGANKTTRATDTTYGFNSNADREDYRLKSASDAPVFTVWDGGGVDTLDFSKFADDQLINLNAAQPSNIGGMVGNVFIAKGVSIENAKGGTGNDTFIPNRVQNVMTGNGGNNTYKYLSIKHSTPEKPDRITDFVSGKDKIDVSEMHRKGTRKAVVEISEGDTQPVSALLGPVELAKQFSGRRGEAVLSYDPAARQARLEIDVKGNGKPEFLLLIDSETPLKPTDIVVSKPASR